MTLASGKATGRVATLLTLLPAILLVSMIANFAVDVPYWDQWELVPYLQWLAAGKLNLSLLAAQHSEHRLLFPRALMLLLAWLTDWDVRAEMVAGFAFSCVSVLVFTLMWRRSAARSGSTPLVWFPVLVSLCMFSLRQWENWLWGWQLQIHMNVLAVVAGVALLSGRTHAYWRLAGAGLLGVVAQYSFACGTAYWIVAAPVLAFDSLPRRRRGRLLAWGLMAAAGTGAYFHGYVKPPWTPSPWIALRHPDRMAAYVLAYLGGPLCPEGDSPWLLAWSIVAGGVGIALLAWAARRLVRRARLPPAELVPYASLALYALAAAVLTGFGRLGIGASQALVSRYVTISQLFWLATCGLLASSADAPSGLPRARLPGRLLVAVGMAVCVASASGASRFEHAYELLSAARRALLAKQDGPALAVLHPDRKLLWERAATLERLGLSVYRRADAGRPRRRR